MPPSIFDAECPENALQGVATVPAAVPPQGTEEVYRGALLRPAPPPHTGMVEVSMPGTLVDGKTVGRADALAAVDWVADGADPARWPSPHWRFVSAFPLAGAPAAPPVGGVKARGKGKRPVEVRRDASGKLVF